MSASHSCTDVAGRGLDFKDGREDITFKKLKGNTEELCIFFDDFSVVFVIAGVHTEKLHSKGKFIMSF